MTDPGLPDLPDVPEDVPPGGDPGSAPDTEPDRPEPGHPDTDDVVKTSDQLGEQDQQRDAAGRDEDAPTAEGDDAMNEDTVVDQEAANVTAGGVLGQAGVGNS